MRLAVWLSVSGTLLGIFISPIQSMIWNQAALPGWLRKIEPNIQVFFNWKNEYAPELGDYYFFGRLTIFIYLPMLVGLWYVRRRMRQNLSLLRAYDTIAFLLIVALLGDVLVYWISDSMGDKIHLAGFRFIEAPALLLVCILSVFWGFRKRSQSPGSGNFFLITSLGMITGTLFLRYVPHGAIVPLSLSLSVLLIRESGMLNSITIRLEFLSGKRIIWSAFFACIACVMAMQLLEKSIPVPPGQVPALKLDFRAYHTAQDVLSVFTSYGEKGRSLYFAMTLIDMLFPAVLAIFFGTIWLRSKKYNGIPAVFLVAPMGFVIFDWLENLINFRHLSSFPAINAQLGAIGGAMTAYKLAFLFVTYAVLALILFRLSLRQIFRHSANTSI